MELMDVFFGRVRSQCNLRGVFAVASINAAAIPPLSWRCKPA